MKFIRSFTDIYLINDSASIPKEMISYVRSDLEFLFSESVDAESKDLSQIDVIIIEKDEYIDSIIINGIDIINNKKPSNIYYYYEHDIIKASVTFNDFYYVFIYFYKQNHPILLDWVLS